MAILQNRSLGHASTADIANASYVPSDFAVTGETVTDIAITKIIWTGDWKIKRGNSVIWQTANNTGMWDLNAAGISLNSGNTAANLQINSTSSSATLVLGISKVSTSNAANW
jgi:hypothetical protein